MISRDDVMVAGAVLIASAGVFAGYNRLPAAWFNDDSGTSVSSADPKMRLVPSGIVFCGFCVFVSLLFREQDASSLSFLFRLFSLWFLAMISLSDLKTRIIPDQFVAALALIAAFRAVFEAFSHASAGDSWLVPLLLRLAGGPAGSLVMLLIGFAGKRITGKDSLGMGDVKLYFAFGLLTGIEGLSLAVCLPFLIAFPFCVIRLIYTRIRHLDDRCIPFAPFIAASAVLFLLFPELVLINCGFWTTIIA